MFCNLAEFDGFWAGGAFDVQIVIHSNERFTGHRLYGSITSFGAGAVLYRKYLFFLVQSSMHFPQKRSPHPVHSLGRRTTLVQMGQSKMSPLRFGNRSLSKPKSFILLSFS